MNSFFGLGPMELFLIVFIALIVLGPQRLPGTIRDVMKYWKYFRNLSGELTSQFSEEFKDLEDLNPQKILKDLATELDDEVEQTQVAAGIKKKSTKKTGSKKTSVAKKNSSTNAKSTQSVETSKRSDASAAATATVAATAAVAKSASNDAEPSTDDGDTHAQDPSEDAANSEQDAQENTQPSAQNGGRVATDAGVEEVAEEVTEASVQETAEPSIKPVSVPDSITENSILPPIVEEEYSADTTVEVLVDSVPTEQDGLAEAEPTAGDNQQPEALAGGLADNADASDESSTDGFGETPATKKSTGTAEPAPVSVNGQGAHPESEG